MKKLQLEPGKKYRGYAFLNEFGQFDFTPENTGAKAGAYKVIRSTENYSIANTKKKIILHISVDKADRIDLIKNILQVVNQIIGELKNYEF